MDRDKNSDQQSIISKSLYHTQSRTHTSRTKNISRVWWEASCWWEAWGPGPLGPHPLKSGPDYSVDLRIQTYTEPVALKYGKLATKYPWIYGYFLQCIAVIIENMTSCTISEADINNVANRNAARGGGLSQGHLQQAHEIWRSLDVWLLLRYVYGVHYHGQSDRQTDGHADHSSLLPYRGRGKTSRARARRSVYITHLILPHPT